MAKYFVEDTSLIAIADAIRAKNGKTEAMTLGAMPAEIEALSAEELIAHANIPTYVKDEVLELARKVRAVQTSDSITFLAMSDSHYYGTQGESGVDSYVDSNGTQTNESILHGAMAAKILAYALDFDFMTHLGDVTWGYKTTTSELLHSQVKGAFDLIREAHTNIPCFHAIGNHDSGMYYHNQQIANGNTGIFTESGEYLYNTFTALSASDDTTFGGEEYGGYCYRDFADKKLRVFLLNTTERHIYDQTDCAMLGSQRLWLANALIDLNSKTDASKWSIIVLSHYPADYGATMPLSELLKAYVEGGSITISVEDGTSSTVSFAGANSAKFVAQFHGHVHNFKYDKLSVYSGGSKVPYDAWRMCVPNGQFNRENYYTTAGDYKEIDFSEDTTYAKTAGTANDTSFVVNVVIPSKQIIHSFCYGAGYDRVLGYGATTYYSVTRDLTNVTTDDTDIYMDGGDTYSATFTAKDGYDLKTLSVIMGGVDISDSVIEEINDYYGIITIPIVTGNIVITAKAQARPNFTNLVPRSINTDGSDYNVDGDGYDDNVYMSSSGTMVALNGYVTTGYIPVAAGEKTIRIAGDGISFNNADSYCRIAFYDANFNQYVIWSANNLGVNAGTDENYTGIVTEEDSTAMTWTIGDAVYNPKEHNAVYILVTAKGKGENLIVTVNEEITYGGSGDSDAEITYAIVQNLTKVTSSNTQANVVAGDAFSTTLTANLGYELDTVIVMMGGSDVTSSVYSSGKITIPKVTGNISITAKVVPATQNFINLVPLSINTDGSDYNVDGDGYDNDMYITTSATFEAKSGYTTTGYMPVAAGAKTIRIAGDGIAFDDAYCRVAFFDSSFNILKTPYSAPNIGTNDYQGTVTEEDATALTWTIDNVVKMPEAYNAPYILVTAKGDGANLIVTVNEEIAYGGSGSSGTVNYAVIQNLTNVTSSNSQAIAASGSSFSTTLTANSGYELGNVVVTMGGSDVTSSVYSSGKISISNVTGNIVITATANAVVTSYTNQLPISTDTDGSVYNGVGYKADSYISSGNIGTRSGCYASGFIPVKHGDTLYFKNCTIQAEQGNHRFAFYDSNKTWLTNRIHNTTSSQLGAYATPVYGDDGNMTSLPINNNYWSGVAYVRFCCSYLGADSIVTVNEEITD